MKMLSRFSLYGFTKNMQFFEPFLILFFLKIGLTFFQIGILISFRTICINIMEIPSGALADLYGRKNAMLFSLTCYIISFIIFFYSTTYIILFFAIFFFSIGEAFRTGTHKAMIFDWVRKNDMIEGKTKIYGHTRSWSKIGSAVSVIISSIIVIFLKNYKWVFLFSIAPFIIGIWNIICYPSYLNNKHSDSSLNIKIIFTHLFMSIKSVIGNRYLRKLMLQNTGFEGVFRITEDYLQPILKSEAIILAAFFVFPEERAVAVIVGIVYFVINIFSAIASRSSYRIVNYIRSEEKVKILLLFLSFIAVIVSAFLLFKEMYHITIGVLVLYFIGQNIWRTVIISQYDNFTEYDNQATILSIESQTKNLGIFILAPFAGYLADTFGIYLTFTSISVILFFLGIYSVFSQKSPAENRI